MDCGAAMNNPGGGAAAAGNAQIDLMSWYVRVILLDTCACVDDFVFAQKFDGRGRAEERQASCFFNFLTAAARLVFFFIRRHAQLISMHALQFTK